MSLFTPYTYFQCPCSDSSPSHTNNNTSKAPKATRTSSSSSDEDERTFDPRAPRANYSLYPLSHLFFCEDCHQIRCPRCVLDEIVTWYCPNCLFEVPSSTVKAEGNRYLSSSELRSMEYLLIQKTDVHEVVSNARYALLPSRSAARKPRPRDWAPI